MKKMINVAFGYAIAAMVGGVFYREFTKFNSFSGKTTLSVVHTHLFLLGMIMFLVVGLFAARMDLEQSKKFKVFFITYNIGVPWTALLLWVRGLMQVMDVPLSKGADAAISGISGMGHILTGIGIVFLFLCLKESKEK